MAVVFLFLPVYGCATHTGKIDTHYL